MKILVEIWHLKLEFDDDFTYLLSMLAKSLAYFITALAPIGNLLASHLITNGANSQHVF